ncbi:bifunctional diaminohydroxyphosphoribosylaminopyrimidine deaminase/5-amino-6-(5-phosphoribosylamino)uracil reductase RibD [Acidovorax sp. DW039]|uniref:bifunctional diaminohydroxyphosphoribosylaminopyrimidine deaminase/5-amino-6-(5-phosphoribosylamino)uracil reductase RibD n=1 Tax=Acidovorax sp. DW039 TaxID=3095606 RepID=UPI0030893586|nr:bifunctional diaminohydroxyphosphoribosylaminopyrimidine deaminase/5-amino-6-(5-phosphoribosylamino)uracil reductase RibD [Acidovorax sp. DW039]
MTTSSASSPIDQALGLAAQALFLSNPNPRVGCVITSPSGQVLGQGFTQRAGEAHAEIMALRDAAQRGHDVRGATAYVTLEPCSHHGRTGPCCDALVRAGVAKVVASIADPNPQVAGNGFAKLRAAGIEVEVGDGASASRDLNIGFFSRMVRKTPWVRMKVAASLDGTTALHNGVSQWITSAEARADGHAWRARACAVLTGIGTVLDDDPSLNVREVATPRQPHAVVVDSQLQTPPEARLIMPGRQTWVYCAAPQDAAFQSRKKALEAQGATVIHLPNPHGKVDLTAMLHDLATKGVNELHVEAGHKLNGSFVREKLVDEMLVYLAPQLLGTGFGMAQWGPIDHLGDGLPLTFQSVEGIGPDVRIVARVRGRDHFTSNKTSDS